MDLGSFSSTRLEAQNRRESPVNLSRNPSSGNILWMENEREIATEELMQRFEALLTSASLSEEEKQKLSQEMLKIIYQSSEKVTQ